MKTLKIFKIAENSKKFDMVELLYDEINECYTVRWKWTTMRESAQRDFLNRDNAIEKYNERKQFAITCN